MKTKVTERLVDGATVIIHGEPYKAVAWIGEPKCNVLCDLYSTYHGRCTGSCYRWANGTRYVFKRVDALDDNATVYATPLSVLTEKDLAERAMRSRWNKNYYEKNK